MRSVAYVELLVGAFQHQANNLHCNYSLPTTSGVGAGFKMGDSGVPMPEVDGVDAARLASEERDRKAFMASEEGQKLLKEMVEAERAAEQAAERRLVDGDLLEHNLDHGDRKRLRTPSPVWEARKDPKICYKCRKPGHFAKDCVSM